MCCNYDILLNWWVVEVINYRIWKPINYFKNFLLLVPKVRPNTLLMDNNVVHDMSNVKILPMPYIS